MGGHRGCPESRIVVLKLSVDFIRYPMSTKLLTLIAITF